MPAAALTPESSLGEILSTLPGARRALFARYHLGGCQSCGFAPEETLADLCQRAGGLDPGEVLAHLLTSAKADAAMLLDPAEAARRLAGPQPPRLIDIRTREEHEAVAIPNSEFLDQALQQSLFAGDPHCAILLYDHAGRHVLDTCAWFHGHGLTHTRALRGGIDAWSREVDPTLPRYRIEID